MKLFAGIAAAAMITMTGLVPASIAAPASAQRVVVHERTVVRRPAHRVRYRYRNRRVCSNQYRHHHRVRVCRNVRQRYRY